MGKSMMHEYADISAALCDWFESQEIAPSRAVGVMSFLIGVMAADMAMAGGMDPIGGIDLAAKASKEIAKVVMAQGKL